LLSIQRVEEPRLENVDNQHALKETSEEPDADKATISYNETNPIDEPVSSDHAVLQDESFANTIEQGIEPLDLPESLKCTLKREERTTEEYLHVPDSTRKPLMLKPRAMNLDENRLPTNTIGVPSDEQPFSIKAFRTDEQLASTSLAARKRSTFDYLDVKLASIPMISSDVYDTIPNNNLRNPMPNDVVGRARCVAIARKYQMALTQNDARFTATKRERPLASDPRLRAPMPEFLDREAVKRTERRCVYS
jgi:hypothetical protein